MQSKEKFQRRDKLFLLRNKTQPSFLSSYRKLSSISSACRWKTNMESEISQITLMKELRKDSIIADKKVAYA